MFEGLRKACASQKIACYAVNDAGERVFVAPTSRRVTQYWHAMQNALKETTVLPCVKKAHPFGARQQQYYSDTIVPMCEELVSTNQHTVFIAVQNTQDMSVRQWHSEGDDWETLPHATGIEKEEEKKKSKKRIRIEEAGDGVVQVSNGKRFQKCLTAQYTVLSDVDNRLLLSNDKRTLSVRDVQRQVDEWRAAKKRGEKPVIIQYIE